MFHLLHIWSSSWFWCFFFLLSKTFRSGSKRTISNRRPFSIHSLLFYYYFDSHEEKPKRARTRTHTRMDRRTSVYQFWFLLCYFLRIIPKFRMQLLHFMYHTIQNDDDRFAFCDEEFGLMTPNAAASQSCEIFHLLATGFWYEIHTDNNLSICYLSCIHCILNIFSYITTTGHLAYVFNEVVHTGLLVLQIIIIYCTFRVSVFTEHLTSFQCKSFRINLHI